MSMAPKSLTLDDHATRRANLISPEHIEAVKRFFLMLKSSDQSFFLRDEVMRKLDEFIAEAGGIDAVCAASLRRVFRGCQELICFSDYTYALLRPKIGAKRLVRLHPTSEQFEEVTRGGYLEVKDAFAENYEKASRPGLVLDFGPYFQGYPKVREPAEMGEGISFLNRSISGQMYQNPTVFQRALIKYLRQLGIGPYNLLINDHIDSPEVLQEELDNVRGLLGEHPADTPYADLAHEMRIHGFEAGWGADVQTLSARLAMLSRIVDAPDPARFEDFLSWLPLVEKLVMVSPHGWFAQENVLGKPDTGGQVTYVLDQARALERQMKALFHDCGIEITPSIVILTRLIPNAEDTTCNVPREKVHGSENVWIVRVPFTNAAGEVIPHWISRFHIWPYLEDFAENARGEIVNELGGKPDLVVGHYSDGNLVAHLLAERLGRTHCACVHALEKTKYLFSDLRWADMEQDYHFSLQFTADILSYNSADYIITSSYREIAGTDNEMGMFESYETFSMPGLYRVLQGMDPQLARYNIVPPGASEEIFYPYSETDRRVPAATEKLEGLLFDPEPHEGMLGVLEDSERPPVFAMSRVDRVKNLGGLVECFAKTEGLREKANLVILSSIIDPAQSADQEEIEQLHRIHELIEHYNLEGHYRWIAARLDKVETGEIYRIVADHKGVFVQPALMETFGLTVVEAMACGVPVVVTRFGGPAEIVVPGKSGYVENPNDFEAFGGAIYKLATEPAQWEQFSKGGVQRVHEAFNWPVHARNILRLANVYSYWNFLDVMNRSALDQYIHTLYHTVYRPRAQAMPR